MHLLGFQGREALYGGAVGGGKSAGLLAAALRFVDRRGYSALLLRRTFPELSKAGGLMPLALEWLARTDAKGLASRDGLPSKWLFPSGATIEFGHVQHEANKTDYQGAAYQFVGFDELTHFTPAIYLYIGFSRQRRRMDIADIPIQTFASANPGGVGHLWVKRRFIDEREADVMYVPAKVWDNPGLDAEDYELSLNYLPIELRRQLMSGDWGAFEGAAYKIVEDVHLVPDIEIPPEWERFECMDHGLANPTAWYPVAVDYDGNLIVFDEHYQNETVVSDHVKILLELRKRWYPEWLDSWGDMQNRHPRVFADPTTGHRMGFTSKTGVPATIATEYQEQSDGKIVLIPGNNDQAAGHARIRELLKLDEAHRFPDWHPHRGELGAPRLFFVADLCPNLVEQLSGAMLLSIDSGKRGAGEKVDDLWESQHGHAHAALRYGVLTWPDASERQEPIPDDLRSVALLEWERKVADRAHGSAERPRYINV
ncbi:MAG: terminase large subunit domain-containing protein [Vicinamibacteria bacterium]